ncbi:hypothetical protein [Methylomonas fluvii]|uniref:Signal transduction histidine kinase dimerisation/phosphoacceptor domain-containing protein n=1 Tax=Methylomonas fluvii TaxID=1854564 RepID=A0ABR9DL54_9GAMM|nr:hypothetical protein [Methylomonas fluvii]MBD9363825.1 hypothetical protein [Methylomonas fluvii]
MRITLNDMLANIETTETELEKSVEERTSALKIALESSETANVYKAQIMSMVSHEMKTPLHAIGDICNYWLSVYRMILFSLKIEHYMQRH